MKTLCARRLAWIVLLLLDPLAVYAQHPLITEDTCTQGSGVSQLEFSVSLGRDQEGDVTTRRRNPTLVFSHGLLDAVDVFVSALYLQVQTESAGNTATNSGWSDPTLGIKWRFYEQGNLSVAIKPALQFAHGDAVRGLGRGRTGYDLPVVVTRQWDGFAFHAHVGVSSNRNTVGEREHLWHGSVAVERQLNANLKWVVDMGKDRHAVPSSHLHPAYLLGGLVYSFGRMELSAGVKGKLNAAAPDRVFLFGLTWHSQ